LSEINTFKLGENQMEHLMKQFTEGIKGVSNWYITANYCTFLFARFDKSLFHHILISRILDWSVQRAFSAYYIFKKKLLLISDDLGYKNSNVFLTFNYQNPKVLFSTTRRTLNNCYPTMLLFSSKGILTIMVKCSPEKYKHRKAQRTTEWICHSFPLMRTMNENE